MTDELQNYRKQIDAIDERLIALFKERIAIVEQVGKHKQESAPHLFPIRPAREAQLLRNIAANFKDSAFNAATACAIWRLIIGASTHVESNLIISVYATGDLQDYAWLAREYFGPSATLIKQPHIKRVISDVIDGKATIGVVPTFTTSSENNDWASLVQSAADAPKIFAHLPFVTSGEAMKNAPTAFAFSKLLPEDSGDDASLFVLQTQHDVSQNRLQTAFTAANISAQWIGITSLQPDTRLHLVELKGFITPEHTGFQSFASALNSSLQQVTFLGAYATPFTIQSNEKKIAQHA